MARRSRRPPPRWCCGARELPPWAKTFLLAQALAVLALLAWVAWTTLSAMLLLGL